MADYNTGTVKWFNAEKGYGFIKQDNNSGEDAFVHYKDIKSSNPNQYRSLTEGMKVKFKLIKGKKGLEAKEVEAI